MALAAFALADRFALEAARGLQQVSIDIAAGPKASSAAVMTEVEGLFTALDAGRATPLDFGDATRR